MAERKRLPQTRNGVTHKFTLGGVHDGYITVNCFEDGMPGELFIRMAKTGSTVSGMLDAFAISVSLGLQHGVPLKTFVEKFSYLRFIPDGYSGPSLKFATSVLDYIFRWLSMKYLKEVKPEAAPDDEPSSVEKNTQLITGQSK
jgi:ribonucleoside-diphosphate reductase alpha chain